MGRRVGDATPRQAEAAALISGIAGQAVTRRRSIRDAAALDAAASDIVEAARAHLQRKRDREPKKTRKKSFLGSFLGK